MQPDPSDNSSTAIAKRRSVFGHIMAILSLLNGWRLYRMYAGKRQTDLPEEIDEDWDDLDHYGELRTRLVTARRRFKLLRLLRHGDEEQIKDFMSYYNLTDLSLKTRWNFLFMSDEEAVTCWRRERDKIVAINLFEETKRTAIERGAYIDLAAERAKRSTE